MHIRLVETLMHCGQTDGKVENGLVMILVLCHDPFDTPSVQTAVLLLQSCCSVFILSPTLDTDITSCFEAKCVAVGLNGGLM